MAKIKVYSKQLAYPYVDEVEWEFVRECPVCGGRDFSLYWKEKIEGDYPLDWWECSKCTLVFLSPRMSDRYTDFFYANHYNVHHVLRDEEIMRQELRANIFNELRIASNIQPKRHLDIGASVGRMGSIISEQSGCESVGEEPDDTFRNYGIEKYGANLVKTLDELEGKFDLITMSHVLEHFNHPSEFIQNLKKYMTDDCDIMIEVPNGEAWEASFKLYHPLVFKDTSLKAFLTLNGFQPKMVAKHRIPLFDSPVLRYLDVVAKRKPPE